MKSQTQKKTNQKKHQLQYPTQTPTSVHPENTNLPKQNIKQANKTQNTPNYKRNIKPKPNSKINQSKQQA